MGEGWQLIPPGDEPAVRAAVAADPPAEFLRVCGSGEQRHPERPGSAARPAPESYESGEAKSRAGSAVADGSLTIRGPSVAKAWLAGFLSELHRDRLKA